MMLTGGAIKRLATMDNKPDGKPDPSFQPTLQLINFRLVSNPASGDRFRIIMSDGVHFIQGMLATQLNDLVLSNKLVTNSLFILREYICNNIQGLKVIIALKLEPLPGPVPTDRIGTPVDIAKVANGAGGPAAPSNGAAAIYGNNNMLNTHNSNAVGGANPYSAAPSQTHSANGSMFKPPGGINPYSGHANTYNGSSSNAPIVRAAASSGPPITPIAQLNMYQNKWTIRARVMTKSDVRTWSNAKGEGSLFSVELLDSTQDIRATFFKEGVDKFYDFLTVGKVYSLSGGKLKVANQQYNTCKSTYEITFDQNSEIHLEQDTHDIAKQNYNFVKIANIENLEANHNIDILAVVKQVNDPSNIVSKKSGQELTKCDMVLVDDSGVEISMTLWGDKASQAPTHFGHTPIVAFRRARISDYSGKSLSLAGDFEVMPDVPEVRILQQWWQSGAHNNTRSLSSSGGGGGRMESFSARKDIAAIKNENLGYSNPDKPDYISFKGTISFLKSSKEGGAWYPACANAGEPCKNMFRATQTTDGQWTCEKCNGTYATCVRRWIFSGTVADDSSTTWVNFFNEQAEMLLGGTKADEIYQLAYGHGSGYDQDVYDSKFAQALYTEWLFKCRVKNETYNDESRVKTSVIALEPVDYAKEANELLTAIEKF